MADIRSLDLRTFLFFSATVCFLCLSGKGLLLAAEVRQQGAARKALQEAEEEIPLLQPITKPRKAQALEVKSPPDAGNWALGGLYPGASLKYMTGGKSAWELRAQSGSGVFALGPRYYRYFTQATSPRLFFGIEADYITFKGEESKGAGFAGAAFVGGEIFLTKQIGLLMDFGPMYMSLSENGYSQSESGIDYVMNMGIYWHFR